MSPGIAHTAGINPHLVINKFYPFRLYPFWPLLLAALGGIFLLFAMSGCSEQAIVPTLSSTTGSADNKPPSVLFTSSCNNLSCSFDASGSLDSDGSIVSYAWDFDDGTGTGLIASHIYIVDGSYTVILTVTDDAGAISSASQTFFVSSGNMPPSASFSSSCLNLICSFDASASADDGTIVSYSWDFGDNSSASIVAPGHTYSIDGNFTVVLTVTDDQGATSNSSQTVSVSAAGGGNNPPSATFSASCTDLSCNFDASASTDDVGITGYSWDFGDGTSGNTVTTGHIYSSDGVYTVILTVTDGGSASSTSQQSIPVSSGNSPPSAGFSYFCTELSCDFDGSTSLDTDGTVVTYAWDFGDATNGVGVVPSHTYALVGSYSVVLSVTDNDGATSSAAQSVQVSSGQSLYTQHCLTCHGADALGGTLSDKDIRNVPMADITDAIIDEPEMFSLSSLTAAEIQLITNYLSTF